MPKKRTSTTKQSDDEKYHVVFHGWDRKILVELDEESWKSTASRAVDKLAALLDGVDEEELQENGVELE